MTRLRGHITRLSGDESGSVLTFWAVAMAVVLGLLALSFDFGRVATTQSDLQTFADNVALAAAGELDGKDDSIARATAAAAEFISDIQTFGEGDKTLSGANNYTLTFYADRPNDAGTVQATTNSERAKYVRVTVNSRAVAPIFGAAFAALTGGQAQDDTVGAMAVAGFTAYACDITPLMFCAPSVDFRAEDNIGMAIQLRAGGQNAAWGPGAFGWLDVVGNNASALVDLSGVCAGLTGNNLDLCLIAAKGNRTSCIARDSADIANGQRVGNFEAAVNTIFDVYAASATKLRNDPLYPPAGNVRSSYEASNGSCIGNQPVLSTAKMGLPPDDCQVDGSCGRFGDGDWSQGRADYVLTNYGLIDPFPTATTRYDYYKAELDAMALLNLNGNGNGGGQGGLGGALTGTLNTALSLGLPQCSNNIDTDPTRRTMIAAAVDCSSGLIGPGSTDIKVQQFVEIFLMSPVGLDGTADVWVEIVRGIDRPAAGSTSGAVIRDVVVLYD